MAAGDSRAWIAACIVLLGAGMFPGRAQKRETAMTPDNINRQLATARDPEKELAARVDALRQLAASGNRTLAPRLRELWTRPRPTGPAAVNWDPAAVERVV